MKQRKIPINNADRILSIMNNNIFLLVNEYTISIIAIENSIIPTFCALTLSMYLINVFPSICGAIKLEKINAASNALLTPNCSVAIVELNA